MTPQIMNEVFPRNNTLNYNLRRHPEFASKAINTLWLRITKYSGTCWEMLALDLKSSDFLDSFKSGIKNWRPQQCHCRLCEKYIYKVGFTQI